MSSRADRRSVLVVGYGNPLRRDDGAGWEAAERLDTLLSCREAAVLIRHQLTPELAEPVSRADLAIFIDASAVEPAGEVRRTPLEAADDSAISLLHELNPMQLLRTAKVLFLRCPPACLYSIGGSNFDMGEGLTPAVAKAVERTVMEVAEEIRRFLSRS